MNGAKNRLYKLLLGGCVAGYLWLFLSIVFHLTEENQTSICLFKKATGYACPACGTTRSVFAILRGEFMHAIMLNPLGLLVVLCLVSVPVWLLVDWYQKNDSLFRWYSKSENFLREPLALFFVTTAMISNWIWNLMKGI